MLKSFDLPFFNGCKNLVRAVSYVCLGERLIVPVNADILCSGLVALLNYHLYKLGLIKSRADNNLLSLLHVNTAASDKVCIFSKSSLVHFYFSLKIL